VGAFGLAGRDLLTRRFEDAQVLAAAMRTLPLSNRAIMGALVGKDVLFYLGMWIGPALLGFSLVAPQVNVPLEQAGLMAASLSLSFLLGLSVVFFLSTAYAHSAKLFVVLMVAVGISVGVGATALDMSMVRTLPTYVLTRHPGIAPLAISGAIIILSLSIALLFPNMDYPHRVQRFPNVFSPLSNRLPAGQLAPFVAKDLLDLKRSEGGVGKIIFSLLIPAAVIWLLSRVLEEFISEMNILVVFALWMGLITSAIYNWLSELDTFASYVFLPVSMTTILQGKVRSYELLNACPLALIIGAAILFNQPAALPAALAVFTGISMYTVALSVFLTGPFPTVLLYNVKVFFLYTLLVSPILVVLLFVSVLHPWAPATALLLLPLAYYLLQQGYHRWDISETSLSHHMT
jgi:hypothetical protein